MKKGSRFLGIDDGPREVEKLIGVSYRGTEFMEQVEMIDQEPDTGDATDNIIELYSLFNQDIQAILLDGVSFNGFNIADVKEIADRTETPVIPATSNKPDKEAMRSGLKAAGLEPALIDELPEVHRLGDVFVQFSGCSKNEAREIVSEATLQGNTPEPIRAAHLIGTGFNQH